MSVKSSPELYQSHFATAIDFQRYLADFKAALDGSAATSYGNYAQYLPLNWQRTDRLYRQFKLNDAAHQALTDLNRPLRWLVIVEPWCGDVSQSLPVMARLAEASNNRIDLRLAYRDQNPSLIDAHLTDGVSQSIPILVQLDAEYQVTGTWGPRPEEAQALVKRLKSDPSTAVNYAEELHRWYGHNKQQSIQSELLALLKK
ncbi:MAG: thioredoxin family protein [Bacteroidota bacterium]